MEGRQRRREGGRRPEVLERGASVRSGMRQGRAKMCPIRSTRPAPTPVSGRTLLRTGAGMSCEIPSTSWLKRRSRGVQKPTGEIAVAEATAPRRASSSAMPPPIELPATCGRRSPSSSKKRSKASASANTVGATPGSSDGERPKPGTSAAITSWCSASASITGSRLASASRSRGSARAARRRRGDGGSRRHRGPDLPELLGTDRPGGAHVLDHEARAVVHHPPVSWSRYQLRQLAQTESRRRSCTRSLDALCTSGRTSSAAPDRRAERRASIA